MHWQHTSRPPLLGAVCKLELRILSLWREEQSAPAAPLTFSTVPSPSAALAFFFLAGSAQERRKTGRLSFWRAQLCFLPPRHMAIRQGSGGSRKGQRQRQEGPRVGAPSDAGAASSSAARFLSFFAFFFFSPSSAAAPLGAAASAALACGPGVGVGVGQCVQYGCVDCESVGGWVCDRLLRWAAQAGAWHCG